MSPTAHASSYTLLTARPISPVPSPLCITHDITPTPLPTINSSVSNHPCPKVQAPHLRSIGVHVPAKAKRSHLLAFPSPNDKACKRAITNMPVGMSKQAVSKRKILDEVKNGTWVPDPKKWAKYRTELAELDSNFEVPNDPCLARSVKHSPCGSWLTMSLPYNVARFRAHTESCKYSTASGGMKTLHGYGIIVRPINTKPLLPSISSTSSPTDLPCLGITEKEDIQITQYMKRTPVNSAGGTNIHGIAKELFADDFKNLGHKEKDIVRQKQLQTHLWSNHPARKSIHAIGKNPCNGKAHLARDGSLMPCNQCLALLTLHAFRNAISQKSGENGNRRYTPHTFQSPYIGRMYSLGLYELLDGVRTTSIFST